MITLVGVGHVFDLEPSLRRVIEQRRPRVVGVELDRTRFEALQAGLPRAPSLSVYGVLSFIQRRIAGAYGTQAGGEMLAAARAAKEVGAPLAFLDLDSRWVLSRLLREMTWREKARFAASMLGGLFLRKERVEQEIAKFESDEAAFFAELGREFPSVKRILIDERNAHMARAVREVEREHGSIVAVVGEGHVDGLRTLLADRSPEVVRLRDLRAPPAPGTSSVTVSFRA